MYDGIDISDWLLSVADVHESERYEKQSETIYYDQAERFAEVAIYPYPLSRQKTGIFKMDSPPSVTAVGTQGARRATGVPTATP